MDGPSDRGRKLTNGPQSPLWTKVKNTRESKKREKKPNEGKRASERPRGKGNVKVETRTGHLPLATRCLNLKATLA